MDIVLVAAATLLLCFLLDKGFTKTFRSRSQHKTGLAVRLNKRFASIGTVVAMLGVVGIIGGVDNELPLLIGGVVMVVLGIGLIVFYLSFGIYYDNDSFILSNFGKKTVIYRFCDISHQRLYTVTGGQALLELYMTDGRTVQLQSTMTGWSQFLDQAFVGWCNQKEIDPECCAFHDPDNCLWFPDTEV